MPRCDNCKRERPAEVLVFSSPSGRRYCPSSDAKCDRERKRLIRSGAVLLDVENAEVLASVRRRSARPSKS